MKREEAEKLKDEIAETQDMFRRAEHLKIENDIHRLENELNAASRHPLTQTCTLL